MPVISLTEYRPAPRYDGKSWLAARLEGSTDGAQWTAVEIFPIQIPDATNPPSLNFTTELVTVQTQLRIVFIDQDGDEDITDPVLVNETPASLATSRDVRLRLGRDLTIAEEGQVDALLMIASTNILGALGKAPGWDAGTAKPFLSGLCIELASRAMSNSGGLASRSETIGSYSYSENYTRDTPGSGIMLTKEEESAARRVVFGSNRASVRQEGWFDLLNAGVYETTPE